MNATTLYAELRRLVGNPGVNEVSDVDFRTYIESAADWLAVELKNLYYTDEQSLVLVASQVEYALPEDVAWLVWVEWSGNRLEATSTWEMERDQTDWRGAAAGTPSKFAMLGRNLILNPPASADAITTDSALSYRYIGATRGVKPGGVPGLSEFDQRLMLYEAAYEYLIAHAEVEGNLAKADRYLAQIQRLLPAARDRSQNAIEPHYPAIRPHVSRQGGARRWVKVSLAYYQRMRYNKGGDISTHDIF